MQLIMPPLTELIKSFLALLHKKQRRWRRKQRQQGMPEKVSGMSTAVQNRTAALPTNYSPFFFVFQLTPASEKNSRRLQWNTVQPPSTLTVKDIQSSMLFDTRPRLRLHLIGWAALSRKIIALGLAVLVITNLLCTLPVLKLPWDAEQGSDTETSN